MWFQVFIVGLYNGTLSPIYTYVDYPGGMLYFSVSIRDEYSGYFFIGNN